MSSLNLKRFCSTKQNGSPGSSPSTGRENSYWLITGLMRWRSTKRSCAFGSTIASSFMKRRTLVALEQPGPRALPLPQQAHRAGGPGALLGRVVRTGRRSDGAGAEDALPDQLVGDPLRHGVDLVPRQRPRQGRSGRAGGVRLGHRLGRLDGRVGGEVRLLVAGDERVIERCGERVVQRQRQEPGDHLRRTEERVVVV